MASPIRLVSRGTEGYPKRFEGLPKPPDRVWIRGNAPTGLRVAVVGTRRADEEACRFTRLLARRLAASGVGVVSGGALGIDAAAHRGALDADGLTWVVQAAPLEQPYPRQHAELFAAALGRGGWLSETPPGQSARPGRFLARNRLIAALADLVVVVQAPRRSGALSTARWARTLGRPLFVVPGAPWDPRAAGGVALLARDARPCVGADDLIDALSGLDLPSALAAFTTRTPALDGRQHAGGSEHRPSLVGHGRESPRHGARPRRRALDRPEPPVDLAPLREALSLRPRHVDELTRATGWDAAQVQRGLVRLLAGGWAQRSASGWRVSVA